MLDDVGDLRDLLERELDKIPDNKEQGIMLSGGLDSSALACILLDRGRSLRSISASFKGYSMYDETEYVEAIKEKYSQLELNYISPLDINLLDELKELIEIIKEPIISGSTILQYLIIKKAKKLGIKNLIYGQWADELLGGYDRFLLIRAHDDFKRLQVLNALINIKEYIRRAKKVGTNLILLRIIKGLKNELIMSIPNVKHLVDVAQKSARSLDINLILPFENPEIVKFCQSLNSDKLVYRGQTKIILREAVADVLPEKVLNRKIKHCFFAPDAIWLLKNKESIMKIKDKTIRKEYEKFLKNPQKRGYKKLWTALSKIFINQ
jgi:asparagine synthase (glutamine-hydrolysing)